MTGNTRWQQEIEVLLNAVQSAGIAINAIQQAGFSVLTKQNDEVLTQADLQANTILKQALLGAFPDDGWLSEECIDDAHRLTRPRVWIVDPIDGTKEFVTGIPEYAISVALVEEGKPCVAAVYNPATREMFHASLGGGTWMGNARVSCRTSVSERCTLLASRSEYARGEWDAFLQQHEVKVIGSIAYKLALIAAGFADATFSLGPKNEWDIAAGVLLVEEAGGIVTNQQRKPFRFNQKNSLVDGIVAANLGTVDTLFDHIEQYRTN